MTTVAFFESETGWFPCQIRDIKQGQTYYLVRNGVQGEIYMATADARHDGFHDGEPSWIIESKPIE